MCRAVYAQKCDTQTHTDYYIDNNTREDIGIIIMKLLGGPKFKTRRN